MKKSIDELIAIANDKTTSRFEREIAVQSLSTWLMRKRLDYVYLTQTEREMRGGSLPNRNASETDLT